MISTPLPDFEHYEYQMVPEPPESKLKNTWAKYREVERRFEMYKWAESLNAPERPWQRVFLDDCVNAFLLTYEAVFQFIQTEIKERYIADFDLGNWLNLEANKSNYDLTVRGLRTMRIFTAHVENKDIPSDIVVVIGGPIGSSFKRTWRLNQIQETDIDRIGRPKLERDKLGRYKIEEWNDLVRRSPVKEILREGLEELGAILEAAERHSATNVPPQ